MISLRKAQTIQIGNDTPWIRKNCSGGTFFFVSSTGRFFTNKSSGGIMYIDDITAQSWTSATGVTGSITSVTETFDGKLYATGLDTTTGVYKSEDNGETWTKISDEYFGKIYAASYTSEGTEYKFFIGCGGRNGVYYSYNAISWNKIKDADDPDALYPLDSRFGSIFISQTGRLFIGIGDITYSGQSGNRYKMLYADRNQWGYWNLLHEKTDSLNANWSFIGSSSTGRIFASNSDNTVDSSNGTSEHTGIWYSDDDGDTWVQSTYVSGNPGWSSTSNKISNSVYSLPSGRLITAIGANVSDIQSYIIYSDDNGETWTRGAIIDTWTNNSNNHYTIKYATCMMGKYLCVKENSSYNNMWYTYNEDIPAKNAREKYLDRNGAQEFVTQFKSYCDSLVGGA